MNDISTGDLGGSATYDAGSFELAAEQKKRLIALIGKDGDLGVALKKYVKGKNPTYNGLINIISKLPDQIKVVQERVDKVSTSSRNLFNELVTVENSVRRLNELDANSDDYDEATLDNEYAKIIKSQLGVIESSSELLNNDDYVKSLDNLARDSRRTITKDLEFPEQPEFLGGPLKRRFKGLKKYDSKNFEIKE